MLNISSSSLLKTVIILLCLVIRENYSNNTESLSIPEIKQVLYYHNIFRYLVTLGYVRHQPKPSYMQLMKWNSFLANSINSTLDECILNQRTNSCPPMNVYRIGNKPLTILKIVEEWFNHHKYYDYSIDTCSTNSCDKYKRIVASNINYVACSIRKINNEKYFICRYKEGNIGRPYTAGVPCSLCTGRNRKCFKRTFCIKQHECTVGICEYSRTEVNEERMQADEGDFCSGTNVNCEISFYQHMCPSLCSSAISTTKSTTITTKSNLDNNDVCTALSVDCSIEFFKILCPRSCEGVLCRDPNIDCRNIFYVKCQKCVIMNEKMSDSKITSTTITSSLERALGFNDPTCKDISYQNYCIDRGEMCLYPVYEVWMKKFCCSTCRALNACFDYLEFQTPGACAGIQSSGLCSTLWSQTYCRKTCNQC